MTLRQQSGKPARVGTGFARRAPAKTCLPDIAF